MRFPAWCFVFEKERALIHFLLGIRHLYAEIVNFYWNISWGIKAMTRGNRGKYLCWFYFNLIERFPEIHYKIRDVKLTQYFSLIWDQKILITSNSWLDPLKETQQLISEEKTVFWIRLYRFVVLTQIILIIYFAFKQQCAIFQND